MQGVSGGDDRRNGAEEEQVCGVIEAVADLLAVQGLGVVVIAVGSGEEAGVEAT